MTAEYVAILDAGSQYGKLIDRNIRELNVCSEILPFSTPVAFLKEKSYKGIILSGGPESVYSPTSPAYDPELFSCGIPVLGICYGMQLMAFKSGGKVEKTNVREDGQLFVTLDNSNPLFAGLQGRESVLLTHGDSVKEVPKEYRVIAKSDTGLISGIANEASKLYGVQFHPEVNLTVDGKSMFKNFLFGICGCKGLYTVQNREEIAINYIREAVKDKDVLVLVSGGVDSTICVALINKALGSERVKAVHIDNGFMRKDESSKVYHALRSLGIDLIVRDAKPAFQNASTHIKGVSTDILLHTINPEEKRKIIGDTFMRVAEEEIKKLGLDPEKVFLAQGTLRPDLIESASELASSKADAIKTHHNDTELVRILRRKGRIIEPLKDYHKDEVRELGISLGLPVDMVWRQPFPGPGLSIRILCCAERYMQNDESYQLTNEILKHVLKKKNDLAYSSRKEVDDILLSLSLTEVLPAANNIHATLLPVKSVGVQGDGRSYKYVVGLSSDEQNWEIALILAKIIPQICHNVNRIVWVFGAPVLGPLTSLTPTFLSNECVTQLQEADDIVNDILIRNNLIKSISQMPVILLPVNFQQDGARSIVLRPFCTNDFMTGVPATPGNQIPLACVTDMVDRILKVTGIIRVMYDLTSKPPGTTEWE